MIVIIGTQRSVQKSHPFARLFLCRRVTFTSSQTSIYHDGTVVIVCILITLNTPAPRMVQRANPKDTIFMLKTRRVYIHYTCSPKPCDIKDEKRRRSRRTVTLKGPCLIFIHTRTCISIYREHVLKN